MTNGSLMKVESIAECSILQYFRPALRDYQSWKPYFWASFEWPLKTGFLLYPTFNCPKDFCLITVL